jgi:AraC-like DNA-binding protein
MDSVAPWTQFVARHLNTPPFSYRNGVRIPVKRGVCCPMHSHTTIEMVYHSRGSGVTRLEDGSHLAFPEGAVVIYAPNERHDQVMDCAGEDFCVTLAAPSRCRKVPKKGFLVPRVTDAALIEDMRLLSQGCVELTATEQSVYDLRATSTFYALVHLASSRSEDHVPDMERYVRKAEQYVRDHFASLVTLKEAARETGIGYDHLRHAMKARRGRGLARYLTEVRIERAKTLLIHSQLSLKQVASQCGFRDEYYFSTVFRRVAGMPPGRYRARRI